MNFKRSTQCATLSLLTSLGLFFGSNIYANDWKQSGVLQFGLDAWYLKPSVKQDNFYGPSPKDADLSHTMLAMPSSGTAWHYRPVSPWYKFQGSISPTRSLVFSTKFRADQSIGLRLDELSADYSISEFLGIRAGVVDYKLSWCSAYDVSSPWIYEPNAFCSMRYTTTISGGAPGLQTYLNNQYGSYRLQTIAGVYMPTIANYDKNDFGNIVVDGSPQMTDKNLKYGISLNLLNIDNGTDIRFSWIQTKQRALSALLTEGRQVSNITYAAMSFNATPRVNIKISRSDYFGTLNIEDNFPPGISWTGVIGNIHFSNSTAELRYNANQKNTLALAYSLYQFRASNKNIPLAVTEMTTITDGKFFMLDRHQISGSWRYDWDSGVFAIAQLSYTNVINGYLDGRYKANALAAGLRVGYVY